MSAAPSPSPPGLSDRIAGVLDLDPGANALEFEGTWFTWGQLSSTAHQVAAAVGQGSEVGIILRNRPGHVGALLGVLLAGGIVVTINPSRGLDRTREDIAGLALDAIVGSTEDLAQFVSAGSVPTTIAVGALGEPIGVSAEADAKRRLDREQDTGTDPVAVRMLTSGTTGPPKRIDLTYETLLRVMLGAKYYEPNATLDVKLRSGVAVINSPLVHLGGLFRVLLNVTDGRSSVLLERFTVDGWYDAVRRHHPKSTTLVPAALRMVLEADLDPAELSSLRSVISGTAPLSPDDADAFYEKYGVPVLISYAATEFGGGVAGWNIADHREWWSQKRGSVGRAQPGSELRIVDEDDGRVLAADEVGLLEVKTSQLGDDAGWMRTTDRARIDSDGFLFILGRADQAIIRGGFKVHPDEVRAALEAHPGVRGAAVIGVDDDRLGAVPVAVAEVRPVGTGSGDDAPAPDADALLAFLADRLTRYEIPVAIEIVDDLPRTDSGKTDLGAIRDLVASARAAASDHA